MPGRVRKPSSKMQFLEAHSADWDDHQKHLDDTKDERKRSRKASMKRNAKGKGKSKSKKKGSKHGGPKKAKSAYIFFANDTRPEVKEEFPNAKFGEIAQILGEWWADATTKERKKYERKAAEDKIRYERECQEGIGSYTFREDRVPRQRAPKAKKPTKRARVDESKDGKMSYYGMAREALLSLKDRKGSSQIAIEKWIIDNFPECNFQRHCLRKCLKTHTDNGRLLRVKNSWKLTPEEKKKRR